MRLRPLEPEDLEFLYTIENSPELWDSTDSEAPYSRHALRQYLSSMRPMQETGELRMVIEVMENGSLIPAGMVELTNISFIHARAEVGIALLCQFRKHGLGTRAIELIETLGKTRLRLHQLYAFIAEENEASERLFQQAGYTPKCTLEDWKYSHGAYHSVRIFQKVFKKSGQTFGT